MESCWYLQERLVHATKKSQYLTMQWTSQNHRGSLSLSLLFFLYHIHASIVVSQRWFAFFFLLLGVVVVLVQFLFLRIIEEMKHICYFDSPFCSCREEAIKRIVEIIFIGVAGKLCGSSEQLMFMMLCSIFPS